MANRLIEAPPEAFGLACARLGDRGCYRSSPQSCFHSGVELSELPSLSIGGATDVVRASSPSGRVAMKRLARTEATACRARKSIGVPIAVAKAKPAAIAPYAMRLPFRGMARCASQAASMGPIRGFATIRARRRGLPRPKAAAARRRNGVVGRRGTISASVATQIASQPSPCQRRALKPPAIAPRGQRE